MRWLLPVLPLVYLGCAEPPPAREFTEHEPEATDYVPETTNDTGPFGTDYGHVALIHWPERINGQPAKLALSGVFVEENRGWVNLAQCLGLTDTYCATELPEVVDDYVFIEEYDDTILDDLNTRKVGDPLTLEPFSASYVLDNDTGIGRYWSEVAEPLVPGTPLNLSIVDGDWGAFDADSVVDVPEPMVVTSPDPLRPHNFNNGAPVEFRWEPGTSGNVYLAVVAVLESRLYLLEDDGEFDLDLASMGLGEFDNVSFSLGRWSTETVEIRGHMLDVHVQSDQWIYGVHRDVQGRDPLIPSNNCADVAAADPITSGSYWGDMSVGYQNNHDPGVFGCTGWPEAGQDGVLKVVLEPGQSLAAEYTLVVDDAAMYLITTCGVESSCIVGADAVLTADTEVLSYFNNTEVTQELYLVLDAYDYALGVPAITDLFYLDIEIETLEPDVLIEECADAMLGDPILPGSYYGNIAGFANILDPGGVCTSAAPAGEGIAKVNLLDGETLTATVGLPGHNPVVYLLYSCNFIDSCAIGVNDNGGTSEVLTYTNTSGGSENLYLVVDAVDNVGEYSLSIIIQ